MNPLRICLQKKSQINSEGKKPQDFHFPHDKWIQSRKTVKFIRGVNWAFISVQNITENTGQIHPMIQPQLLVSACLLCHIAQHSFLPQHEPCTPGEGKDKQKITQQEPCTPWESKNREEKTWQQQSVALTAPGVLLTKNVPSSPVWLSTVDKRILNSRGRKPLSFTEFLLRKQGCLTEQKSSCRVPSPYLGTLQDSLLVLVRFIIINYIVPLFYNDVLKRSLISSSFPLQSFVIRVWARISAALIVAQGISWINDRLEELLGPSSALIQ